METRRGLIRHINWNQIGIDEIEEASDAQEALKVAHKIQPDIILSDVRMPGLTGIQLCKILREEKSEAQIVFLSGFSDKNYLKEAIELSAISYVEKPIDIVEVEQVLRRAVQKCELLQNQKKQTEKALNILSDNHSFLRNRIMSDLVAGNRSEELEKDLDELELFRNTKTYYRVVILKLRTSEKYWRVPKNGLLQLLSEIFALLENIVTYKDDHHVIIILSGKNPRVLDEEGPAMSRLCSGVVEGILCNDALFCGVGKIIKGIENIPFSYQEAVIMLQKVFYYGYNRVEVYYDGTREQLKENTALQEAFQASLETKNREKAEELIINIYRYYKAQSDVLVKHIKHIYFQMINYVMTCTQSLKELFGLARDEQEQYLWEEVNSFDTLIELSECLRENTKIYFSYFEAKPGCNTTIMNVVNLVRQNYGNTDLSVKLLAQRVYLTPTYLSQLFTKEMGKTISQYITEVRIESSKELLKDKKYKLYDIAELVGYANPNYYAKIFKKQTGMVPSEYREKHI